MAIGAGKPFLANDLEGDDALHVLVLRLVDHAHRALAQPIEQDVGADAEVPGLAGSNHLELEAR